MSCKVCHRSYDEEFWGCEFSFNIQDKHLTDEDIRSIAEITQLTHLILDNNGISDISALSTLTYLKELWLKHKSISDISALKVCPKLSKGKFLKSRK